jgi:hypothetical protein
MNLAQLAQKIQISPKGNGTFLVRQFNGDFSEVYNVLSNNSQAYDRINNLLGEDEKAVNFGYTLKQAYKSLWDELQSHKRRVKNPHYSI